MRNSKFIAAFFSAVVYLASGFAFAADSFRLQSPQSRQIVQRDANNLGIVEINGQVACSDCDLLQARAVLNPIQKSSDWQESVWQELTIVSWDNGKIQFTGSLFLQAGGWYEVQLRAMKNGVVHAERSVPRVGIGEVFIVAGQSNGANYGQSRNKPKSDRISVMTLEGWKWAEDPMPMADGKKGSPWPALGDRLEKVLHVPIGFAVLGVSATSTKKWLPDGELFPKIKYALSRVGPQGARAILWHQGESDAKEKVSAETYVENMKQIIHESRKVAGWEIPWITAQASYLVENAEEDIREIQKAQKMLWDQDISLEGPSTDHLRGALYRYDEVHFSDEAIKINVDLWYKFIMQHFFKP